MKVAWDKKALADFQRFEAKEPKLAERIVDLLGDIKRDPFTGIGKPEPLRFELQGAWSRRIDQKHRLIYTVEGDTCYVVKCRGHYGDK